MQNYFFSKYGLTKKLSFLLSYIIKNNNFWNRWVDNKRYFLKSYDKITLIVETDVQVHPTE